MLHNFGTIPNDIVTPSLGLFAAPEGLYGVDQGGAGNFGALYLLTPPAPHTSSWTQHILYSFTGELVRDASGNFYGNTAQGGVNNLGAVYEISPPATAADVWTEKVLYSFNGNDGTIPAGRLLVGPGGVLYGTAASGGANGAGLVFQLTPPAISGDPWTETILTGGADGTGPENGVISNSRGQLFGTAGNTIFMLRPPRGTVKSWKEVVLHNFSGPDGLVAIAPLTMFKGALYGTNRRGRSLWDGHRIQVNSSLSTPEPDGFVVGTPMRLSFRVDAATEPSQPSSLACRIAMICSSMCRVPPPGFRRTARHCAGFPLHIFVLTPGRREDLGAPTDGNEKATLVPKSTNPSKLCQPALKVPVVFGRSEQLFRILAPHCAWIRAQVLDAIFGKPALHLG
jgi:uncharacterized repeat protein (TIGR03803 family)